MPFTLATFNVKDYFDSPRNAPVLAEKAAEIARHVTRADADVVALQEIGSEALVRAMLVHVPFGVKYTVIFGGADHRGIGNALLSRLPIVESETVVCPNLPFPVFRVGDPAPFPGRLFLRRPVVRMSVDTLGMRVSVFSTHWKSKLPKPEEDPNGVEKRWEGGSGRAEADLRSLLSRGAEALFVRRLVERFAVEGEVVVAGDLNDTIDSIPVKIVRGVGEAHELYPAAEKAPPEARVSTLHRGMKEQIDHVLATASLHERLTRSEFFNDALRDHPFDPDASPTTDSDHAMLVAVYG